MKAFFCTILTILAIGSIAVAADYPGTVVGPDGKPVKGAAVYLFTSNGPAQGQPKIDPPTTRADDNGHFDFPQIAGNANELVATADGFGAGSTAVQAGKPSKTILHPRTDLILTFIGPDNKPAAGVPISLLNMDFAQLAGSTTNLSIPEGFNSPIAATTDANGVCTIAGLAQGSTVDVTVNDDRYAILSDQDEQMLAFQPKTRADPIHLLAACTISGHVRYASNGKAAPGIKIDGQSSSYGSASAITSSDGSYVLKQLRPGRYIVALHPDENLEKNFTAKAAENIVVGATPAVSGVDLSLIPGVMLTGTVVAADDDKPVPGVSLAINGPAHPREGAGAQMVQTDANGAFSARVVPGEELVYVASDSPADGFTRPSPDSKTVTVPEGGTQAVQFRLPRVLMAPIVGKVVDPDGNPIAGASVFLSSDQMPMYQRMSITTKSDGTFQTIPVQRTVRIQLRARSGDLATSKALIVSRATSGDVTIQLEKGALASISGRVIDSKGQPVKGAQIELIVRTGRSNMWQDSGISDDQGNYKIESLWPDVIYYVDVARNGYGETETAELRPQAGQTLVARDLTLYKRDSTVAGVLLDANNRGVAGERIYVNGPKTGYNNLTTDSDGKFTCSVVNGDSLIVFYNYTPQRGYSRTSAHSGDQNIVLHTAPPRLVTPRSIPVPAAPAQAVPAAARISQINVDPAALTTWRAWGFSAILIAIGGAITIIANAIGSIRARKPA